MSDSSLDPGQSYIGLKIEPKPSFDLVMDSMVATEELGRPFLISLDLSSGKVKGDIKDILGASVTVTMTEADKSTKKYFNGHVARASFTGVQGGVFTYHIELRPWIWLLQHTSDCKIFQKKSPWDIIGDVFRDKGFTSTEDKRQNQAGSTELVYCTQYRESAFNFVTRLMEQYGIYYFFTHSDGDHKLVFADDSNSHTSIGDALPFTASEANQTSVEDHVWEWTSHQFFRPGKYTHTDYNFTTPAADLTGKSIQATGHKHDDFEVFDYPGLYENADDGGKQADVRMQEHKARLQVFQGQSNARSIRCGVKFSLKDTDDPALAQEYLVIKATTSISMAESKSSDSGKLVDSHKVEFSAIAGTIPFRLEQITPRAMIRGVQTAKVVGASGDEITTDEYGRIKVQFNWDRVGTNDENSSCWIRVAQSWAGVSWGSMFIPRVGMEVVVTFEEGNPDRPIAIGAVYNATQTVPYPLPDNKTRSTIKSNSSTGGGGFNEIRFEDKKGEEEVFFQAQKDFKKVVLNSESIEVTQDHATTIKQGKHETTVSQGDHSLTVSAGNHKMDVSAGGAKMTTGQAFEVTANTEGKITATTAITLTVGGSTVKIEPSAITLSMGGSSVKIDPSGVTVSGPMVKASGDAMVQIQGAMVQIN